MGAESCGASTCHGSTTARNAPRTGIRQTEYAQWQANDKHAKAYEVLLKDRSLVMAKNLRMTEPPSKSNRCVVCHSLYAPKELQSASYKVEDGVSCEACHGQAEGWLGTHIARGYAASASIGMYDTRNLVKRAEKCVSCHVGDEIRNVDHELIAAGHPDLVFDFETYTAMLPPHWRTAPSDGVGGRAWTVGQVVALRESLKRLARRTQQRAAAAWPEFAEFECFACHHDVNNIESSIIVAARRTGCRKARRGTLVGDNSGGIQGWRGSRPGIRPATMSCGRSFRRSRLRAAPHSIKS